MEVTIPAGVEDGAAPPPHRARASRALAAARPATSTWCSEWRTTRASGARAPHVYLRVEVAYPQAVLGATIEVETLHGAGAAGDSGRHPARGSSSACAARGSRGSTAAARGDHLAFVRLQVPAPREVSDEERELLKRLAELQGRPVRERRGVKERVRDLFG